MRFSAAILLSALLAATPVFSTPAPAPAFEDNQVLEARFHISPKVKTWAKEAGHVAVKVAEFAAPYAADALLAARDFESDSGELLERDFEYDSGELLEREFDGDEESFLARREELDSIAELYERDFTDGELEYLERRMSQKAQNAWHKVGEVGKQVWETLAPPIMEAVAEHYKWTR